MYTPPAARQSVGLLALLLITLGLLFVLPATASATGETGSFMQPLEGHGIPNATFSLAAIIDSDNNPAKAEVRYGDHVTPLPGCDENTAIVVPTFPSGFQMVCSWDPSALSEGPVSLELWVRDTGGSLVNVAGAPANISVIFDKTLPAGGSLTVVDTTIGAASYPVTFTAGTDTNPGHLQLERAAATLTNGVCGSYGAFAQVNGNLLLEVSPWADTTVTQGHCYKYRAHDVDLAGNAVDYTPAGVVKWPYPDLDISLSLLGETGTYVSGTTASYTSAGFIVTAAVTGGSGTYSVAFPTVTGFTGGGNVDSSAPFSAHYLSPDPGTSVTPSVTVTDSNGNTANATFHVEYVAPPHGFTASFQRLPSGVSTQPIIAITGAVGEGALAYRVWRHSVGPTSPRLFDSGCGKTPADMIDHVSLMTNWTASNTFADSSVIRGHCVAYVWEVRDSLGNVSSSDVLTAVWPTPLSGSSTADEIAGTLLADAINAGNGNDVANGGPGNDVLKMGAGNDNANGGVGNDRLVLGAGNDRGDGGPGIDNVNGGPGKDTIAATLLPGPNKPEVITTGSGADSVRVHLTLNVDFPPETAALAEAFAVSLGIDADRFVVVSVQAGSKGRSTVYPRIKGKVNCGAGRDSVTFRVGALKAKLKKSIKLIGCEKVKWR